ncbi:MAG: exopolyphosphatase [Cyclobacteriaceae bacterium]|jgi:exopolyphosphatase/guanosine-5'-triphosphate,3'-diphosphate pyrophosphatase|nr:exopolyphosphatase [Cyclobacteriaceae bacterium]MDH4295879.1 exopolyphosphatase [Cyclobacteriaceae bacterium]MDH5248398.1 exopolyphosphatase [Cyclobacteriaceae bacterium]
MGEKIAIIDMGTNTFHLLISNADERGYHIIHRERLAVKIGLDGITRGLITEDGIHRALLAMQSFKNTIDQQGVSKIYAFGTSAVRNASNGQTLVQKIKAVTGIDSTIISGDLEAEYIYRGVKSAMHIDEKSLIMDIGGGSVEFIIGDNDTIFWKKSVEIGAQRLLEQFQKNNPITAKEIVALNCHFEETLLPLHDALQLYNPNILIGSSGTFDTLSDIFCLQHDIHKSAEEIETPLTLDAFEKIYTDLISKDREQRLNTPGMIEMRVDMIVVACCLVRYVLTRHPFNRIRVSTYSLKEGVLASLIDKIGKVNTMAI